ncbi:hypothetical protein BP00DRAFT_163890 [Aspergillus indologenus CBS 114.80]|uniref:Uncharacterized protein n=1 Tax=Aspergillus indologenus CBS 114.80 TaxID=1450541 RepID=A0A2V5ITL2_9EURO|nr:hypothetical protein BP00DRAFT_163890 [Aspergillus indologenus CBS 114.80]
MLDTVRTWSTVWTLEAAFRSCYAYPFHYFIILALQINYICLTGFWSCVCLPSMVSSIHQGNENEQTAPAPFATPWCHGRPQFPSIPAKWLVPSRSLGLPAPTQGTCSVPISQPRKIVTQQAERVTPTTFSLK